MLKVPKNSPFAYFARKKNRRPLRKIHWFGKTFIREEDVVHYESAKFLKEQYPQIVFQSNHHAGTFKKKSTLRNVADLNGTRGLPDLIIFKKTTEYSGLCLELKKPGGRLTPEEKIALEKLKAEGFLCLVIGDKESSLQASVDVTINEIRLYLGKSD